MEPKSAQARLRLATLDGERVSMGYKSGRSTERDTPESCSSSKTRLGGTPARRHLLTACTEMSAALATASSPVSESARSTAGLSSMPSSQPQVETDFNLCSVVAINRGFHPPEMTPLGKIITRELARLGQTQSWLAEECEVSDNAVSKWIKTGKISRVNAGKVAAALGISMDQLLGLVSASDDPDTEWRKLPMALKLKLISMVHEIRGPAVEEEKPKVPRRAQGR